MRVRLVLCNIGVSYNLVVYDQKPKVGVLVFLERAEHFETNTEQIW